MKSDKLRLRSRKRLFAIYRELGYIPWKKPHKARAKRGKGVYMGAKETIPFLNDDAKRTFSHLLLRPGYMMRDYIFRGQHERYLAPFTALLVFYSVITLLMAVFQPGAVKDTVGDGIIRGFREATALADSTDTSEDAKYFNSIAGTLTEAVILTRLDLYPEEVDTPWKESLAAVEADIRSKGIPMFLGGFLLLWMSMSIVLKKYKISGSGSAAASAYIMCQFCVFMFLALAFTLGQSADLGILFMALLLWIDYRQLLGVGRRHAAWLTVKTGLWSALFVAAFYFVLSAIIVLIALLKM